MNQSDRTRRRWERALLDAYYDRRWRAALAPVADTFARWQAGQADHAEVVAAMTAAQKAGREIDGMFRINHAMLVKIIALDEEFYSVWVKDNPPPAEPDIA